MRLKHNGRDTDDSHSGSKRPRLSGTAKRRLRKETKRRRRQAR